MQYVTPSRSYLFTWTKRKMHTATFGYKEEDIVMLTDDARDPRQIPTNKNMVSRSR